MQNIKQWLTDRALEAIHAAGYQSDNPQLTTSTKANFGDYQINAAMQLAKQYGQPPRAIAANIIEQLQKIHQGVIASADIAGPGFINLQLSQEWLSNILTNIKYLPDLGYMPTTKPTTTVVDYSSPNLAKEMHIGHLRATVIGDVVARVLEYRGEEVIRQNHMGDWGTQFGMLIAHLQDQLNADVVAESALADLEVFYREAKIRFDNEEGFADRARVQVVKLQQHDPDAYQLWKQFIHISIAHSEALYRLLDVSLAKRHIMAESAYNPWLADIVNELMANNIAVNDQGAKVVFLPEFSDKDNQPAAFIIEKSGGGYLYSTTDLAAVRYRTQELGAKRIIIFTDARQTLHFKQVEATCRKAGLLADHIAYEHRPFGMILGKDSKPFKTRSGDTVKLADVLEEAVQRADQLLQDRQIDLTEEEREQTAQKMGIAAVKFADLSKNRSSDYIFDWDTMLSFDGATAPYLQYAYTRIASIFRKAGLDLEPQPSEIILNDQAERQLAIKIMQWSEMLEVVAKDCTPHVLCQYLYELAVTFMRFYEACPILSDHILPLQRESRLNLCFLTADLFRMGFDLLGIATLDKM